MREKFINFLSHPIVQLLGGSGVIAVITWIVTHLAKLPLWEIWLAIIISVGVGLLIVNQVAIWRERTKKKISKFSDEELCETIHKWISKPIYKYKIQSNVRDDAFFSFTIDNPWKRGLEIIRPKDESSVIRLGVTIGLPDELVSRISALPERQRTDIVSGLIIELARIGILWRGVELPLKNFVIEDVIPINDDLAEFYLIQRIRSMDRAIIIVNEYTRMMTNRYGK